MFSIACILSTFFHFIKLVKLRVIIFRLYLTFLWELKDPHEFLILEQIGQCMLDCRVIHINFQIVNRRWLSILAYITSCSSSALLCVVHISLGLGWQVIRHGLVLVSSRLARRSGFGSWSLRLIGAVLCQEGLVNTQVGEVVRLGVHVCALDCQGREAQAISFDSHATVTLWLSLQKHELHRRFLLSWRSSSRIYHFNIVCLRVWLFVVFRLRFRWWTVLKEVFVARVQDI